MTNPAWHGLIKIALKCQRRLGKFHNVRYDRMIVYTVSNVRELAAILVDAGTISSWPGGYRRLITIEKGVVVGFRKIHNKYHTDP